ncbi:MAG: hypothetical protein ACJ71F_17580 [Nitrososphaeraceae archaeon]
MKLELLTNATVVDDAIRFVAERGYKESKEIAVILDVTSISILKYRKSAKRILT